MEDSHSSPTMVDPRKTTLLNALKNILSPSEHTRKKAEELVKALQVIESEYSNSVEPMLNSKIETVGPLSADHLMTLSDIKSGELEIGP